MALPAYREEVLARAPAIARHEPRGARSVFFGYDFHLDGDRLGLIEINTNADGAMLNAVVLTDPGWLASLGVPALAQETLLANISRTQLVSAVEADRMWSDRRHLFFKPTAGYGGRAAYRGDKLTKRVYEEILAGDYVAQALVAPGQRVVDHEVVQQTLKFDLRNYAYDGEIQWVAARLYQGQTTNFRTLGGGFAPVYGMPRVDSTKL